MRGTLYFGDNLDVLREHIGDASVDLVYLDPPFNSAASYNVLFKAPDGKGSQSQITAFEDTWHWSDTSELAFDEVMRSGRSGTATVLRALRTFLGENDMMAYLAMMAVRLIELNRVLKPIGSLYLHCDPTASHYLKIVLDAIFGHAQFGNELIWKRQNAKSLAFRRYARDHDVIFRYTKSDQWVWNSMFKPHEAGYVTQFYKYKDPDGRVFRLSDLTNPNKNRPNLTYEFLGVTRVWRWTRERMTEAYDRGLIVQTRPGGIPQFKRYFDQQTGTPIDDVWLDINPVQAQSNERLGYPTQKPVALLERIIAASSCRDGVVLDAFCGCGTTVHAAHKLDRQWIGIDVTPLAINLIERRLREAFPGIAFDVRGIPRDLDGARELASRDKHLFQLWAVTLVDAQPYRDGKRGADGGIDGLIYFKPDGRQTKAAIVSVKGGAHVGVAHIRDLRGTIERLSEPMGIFVTLAPPTQAMEREAASAGLYDTGHQRVPKIQILTIEQLLGGAKPRLPLGHSVSYRRAEREVAPDGQVELGF